MIECENAVESQCEKDWMDARAEMWRNCDGKRGRLSGPNHLETNRHRPDQAMEK